MTYQSGPQITERQKQIIYGTILGGSSIIKPKKGKNCYLAMRDNHKEWLEYKVNLLHNLFKTEDTIKKDKNTYRCYSVAYPIFNEIHNIFYSNKNKIVSRDTLELLTDQAWMVWFTDSGRKSSRKCYLRTHKFGEKGSNIIAEYFNSLECECEVHKSRNRFEIIFTNKGSLEFLQIISPSLPSFLKI
jgi:hypothetical protein